MLPLKSAVSKQHPIWPNVMFRVECTLSAFQYVDYISNCKLFIMVVNHVDCTAMADWAFGQVLLQVVCVFVHYGIVT